MLETRVFNGDEIKINKRLTVTGTGAIVANVLRVIGAVRVLDQYAIITRVGTLNNATAVYATAYDGTNTSVLTANGATLSGFTVGSLFTKDMELAQPYSVMDASQVRVNEVLKDKYTGSPFTVVQKAGTNTYIRLHLTTTDNPIDFDVDIYFKYKKLGIDSDLEFL